LVKDEIYNEDLSFAEIEHPMVKVMEMTGREKFEKNDLDWMNMWSISIKRMMIEGAQESDVVVSSSCGVDNVCLQAAWLAEQVDRSQGSMSLVDAEGNPLLGEEGIMINRSGSVLQAIMNSAEEEVFEMWDFVYAVVPVEVELSAIPAPIMAQYQDFLGKVPVFKDIMHLPDNPYAAADALREESVKWKKELS
jgi:hypothetical protein